MAPSTGRFVPPASCGLDLAPVMSAVRRYRDQRRAAASCARIKHLVTRWSQDDMHLFSFVPAPGLVHLPTQFAALFSHRGASITARAGE
jgi:hypothetical protein